MCGEVLPHHLRPSASIRGSPFPTPRALCHKARGCTVPGATPGSGHIAFPTPQGVVPFMPIGRVDQTQAGSDPVPSSGRRVRPGRLSITQKISHSTCSTLRHNPPWGCDDPAHPPGVAPRRRNPGLYGRIPLGFPEGDGVRCDLRIPGWGNWSTSIPRSYNPVGIPRGIGEF